MKVEFDPAKNEGNIQKHGVSLERAEEFDFSLAAIRVDDREDYGEVRYQAIGWIGSTLHTLIFTMRGDTLRAISLRKADRQEARRYAKEF